MPQEGITRPPSPAWHPLSPLCLQPSGRAPAICLGCLYLGEEVPRALRGFLIQPERSLVTLASRLPFLAHHLPTTLSPALLLFPEALQGGLTMCEEVRAGVTRGWEFCEAVCPHPQTSHSSFPSRCSRSRRPGLRHLEMGSWSTRALWALAASESLQDALLCLATRALHLLFQPVARKAPKERAVSETHTPRLPWWHFPKRRLSPWGGVVG